MRATTIIGLLVALVLLVATLYRANQLRTEAVMNGIDPETAGKTADAYTAMMLGTYMLGIVSCAWLLT